jgi:hypothetical protein
MPTDKLEGRSDSFRALNSIGAKTDADLTIRSFDATTQAAPTLDPRIQRQCLQTGQGDEMTVGWKRATVDPIANH